MILSYPSSLPLSPMNPNPNPSPSSHPSSLHHIPARHRLLSRRAAGPSWDPNAESVRSGRFGFSDDQDGEEEDDGDFQRSRKRRWWSDDPYDGVAEEFDPFDEDDDNIWDKIWIFKIFRSYGYLLPAIITSMLLATGPKAFLMALALPLGQSALSLAIEKVWGRAREPPRRKSKTTRKPFGRASSEFREQKQEESSSDRKGGPGYQSWVAAEDRAADEARDPHMSNFGGWDELDKQRGPTRSQVPRAGRPAQAEPGKKGKLSQGGRYRDVPLLMRLLIAVFPFLGSWTKVL